MLIHSLPKAQLFTKTTYLKGFNGVDMILCCKSAHRVVREQRSYWSYFDQCPRSIVSAGTTGEL